MTLFSLWLPLRYSATRYLHSDAAHLLKAGVGPVGAATQIDQEIELDVGTFT